MRQFLATLVISALAFSPIGCSVYMEATRPTPVDLTEYQPGQTRDSVLERLGPPDGSAKESDGADCDFYKLYTKGYGAGGKIPIAFLESAADFFSIGLAEAVLTPTEGATKNEKHPVTVCYKDSKIARVSTDTAPGSATPSPAEVASAPVAAPSPQAAPSPAVNSNSASPSPAVAAANAVPASSASTQAGGWTPPASASSPSAAQ